MITSISILIRSERYCIRQKVKLATDPPQYDLPDLRGRHRHTFTLLNPPEEGCQRQHLTGQAFPPADSQKERVSSLRDKKHSKYSISAKSILSELQLDINKFDSYLPEGLTDFIRRGPPDKKEKLSVCVCVGLWLILKK